MNETMMEASVKTLQGHRYEGKHSPHIEDFDFVDAGTYREVYFSRIDGLAYKIGDSEANIVEFQHIERLNDSPLPPNVRMPKAWLIELPESKNAYASNSVVMEFIPLVTPLPKDWGSVGGRWPIEKALGVRDLHDDNVRIDSNGFMVPIDLGDCWGYTE